MAASFASRYGAAIHWFPGHMAKASAAIISRAKAADVIIEVRDARIPFTSASAIVATPDIARKPRIIVLTKADLALDALKPRVEEAFARATATASPGAPPISVLYTSNVTAGRSNARALLSLVDRMPCPSRRFKEAGTILMVVGVSNVGKSTLINALKNAAGGVRDSKGAKTGAAPGITRGVSSFCVRPSPSPVYVLDTPGVLSPHAAGVDAGMRLLLCGILPEKTAPWEAQAEFILHYVQGLGQAAMKRVCTALGLSRVYSADDAPAALAELAARLQSVGSKGEPDLAAAARHVVREFQRGALGRFVLDAIPAPTPVPSPSLSLSASAPATASSSASIPPAMSARPSGAQAMPAGPSVAAAAQAMPARPSGAAAAQAMQQQASRAVLSRVAHASARARVASEGKIGSGEEAASTVAASASR